MYMERAETVGDPGSMQQEEIVRISPEFFTTLGVSPAIGRNFTEEETAAQKNVIILTDAFWRERFNSDPNILGRDTRINGIQRKIVGVLPPAFRFLSSEARVFLPIKSDMEQRGPKARHSGGGGTHMIARLKPGATIAEAQAQIDAHNDAVEKDNPEAKMMAEAGFRSLGGSVACGSRPFNSSDTFADAGRRVFPLLIGAVNLMNLFLIRASGRAKEMAIRQSMGASRGHVVRQVMIETVLLTATGGLLGCLGGRVGNRICCEVLGANRLPLGAHIAFDGWLASIGLVGSVVLGVVIAVPIAWFNLRTPSRECAPIGIAHGHDQPRRATAAPRIHRRADCARICLARGRGAARSELEKSDGGFARISLRSRSHRRVHRLMGSAAGASRHRRSLARIHPPATGNRRHRNDHEHSAERRQRQNRSHT